MARMLTTEQREMLRAANLEARLLTTWWMDAGTYRYCDDVYDIVVDGNTYIGASALASASDIRSSNALSAESVTLTLDGARLNAAGFADPAEFFRTILQVPLVNRRVDLDLAVRAHGTETWSLIIPMYAGKINSAKVIDPRHNFGETGKQDPGQSKLTIELDSLALRYQWISNRTRSHNDQLAIDPDDHFFSFVQDNVPGEKNLYWGKKTPINSNTPITGFSINGYDVQPEYN